MDSRRLKRLIVLAVFGLCGCQFHPQAAASPESMVVATSAKKDFDIRIRNNSLVLLNELLNEEKRLSMILIIKRESPELNRLITDIAETAAEGAKRLQSMAKNDPGLALAKPDLPPGEQATRKAIAKTKQHLLLQSKDAEFEFQLLLTQAEALNYGAHLAAVAAENEPQSDRVRELSDLSSRLKLLYEQVITRLRMNK
jgi:hypothetical protein